MALQDQIVDEALGIYAVGDFNEAMTYNGVEIQGLFERWHPNLVGNTYGRDGTVTQCQLWVRKAEVPTVNISRDKVVRNGEAFMVSRVLEEDPGMWCLELLAEESPW